jgi:glutathione synthase/RimK-type ligase-like ATP-grasp enzyme
MILVCGIPSESPLRRVLDRLAASGANVLVFNQREFAECELDYEVSGGQVAGNLRIRGRAHPLAAFQSIYTRLMDDRYLPELDGEAADSARRRQCRGLHEALLRWTEIAPQLSINRPSAMASNISKPYQTQLIRDCGFRIPETLVTNEPDLVRRFWKEHRHVIYKSVSAVRSIVQDFAESDSDRLEQIRWCPTQFQAFVPGTNVRVHVVGEHVFATAVETAATDYRYAAQQVGVNADLREVELSHPLMQRCIALTAALGLVFAGIDLKITPDDQVYCFEVNPSPAFSYYESHTGQPISSAVAYRLMHPMQSRG